MYEGRSTREIVAWIAGLVIAAGLLVLGAIYLVNSDLTANVLAAANAPYCLPQSPQRMLHRLLAKPADDAALPAAKPAENAVPPAAERAEEDCCSPRTTLHCRHDAAWCRSKVRLGRRHAGAAAAVSLHHQRLCAKIRDGSQRYGEKRTSPAESTFASSEHELFAEL